MTATLSPETTVGQMVRQRPARSRVFETFKIDYCCGGKLSLAEACDKAQVDPRQVIEQLRLADQRQDATQGAYTDADAMGLSELADHSEQTHHVYLRSELPRLDQMTHKVASVHGDAEPRLHQLRQTFEALRDELTSHMLKEERILFPMIRQIERSQALPAFHCGSLANPVAQMEHEHDVAGNALEQFRALTDDYAAPDWACNTYRAMLDGLATLEADLHQHIHKENNVLFPRAMEREQALAGKDGG